MTVQCLLLLATVIESYHRDMDISAIKNPIAVADGEEDVTRFFDALENFPIGPAANGLRC